MTAPTSRLPSWDEPQEQSETQESQQMEQVVDALLPDDLRQSAEPKDVLLPQTEELVEQELADSPLECPLTEPTETTEFSAPDQPENNEQKGR